MYLVPYQVPHPRASPYRRGAPKPFSSSGGEATVKACGVAVAMLPE
jgi:hypothetical protein